MELRNKTAVITGTGKGLGKELAKQLTALGMQVLGSDRTEEGEGGNFFKADVTREADVVALREYALKTFGHIDLWINNAGSWIPYMPFETVEESRLRQLFDVNFFGTWNGCKQAMAAMRPQKSGTILNILSVRPLRPRAGSAAYCASKAAGIGLTQTLRLEASNAGIVVIGVYPAGIQTALFDEDPPEDYASYMKPEDAAAAIIKNLQLQNPEQDHILEHSS